MKTRIEYIIAGKKYYATAVSIGNGTHFKLYTGIHAGLIIENSNVTKTDI